MIEARPCAASPPRIRWLSHFGFRANRTKAPVATSHKETSTLEQVYGAVDAFNAEITCQGRMFFGHFFVHGIGNVAVGEVAGLSGAQFGNVERFSKIHLKQRALTERQRKHIKARVGIKYGCKLLLDGKRFLHCLMVALFKAGGGYIARNLVAVG